MAIKSFVNEQYGFLKNVGTIFSGGLVSIIIGVALLPILSRLYPPESFGVAQLFISSASSMAIVTCLRYPAGIVLPRGRIDLYSLVALALYMSIIVNTLLFLIICVNSESINAIFNMESSFTPFLYLLPAAIFLLNLDDILSNMDIRDKKFKNISTSLIKSQIVGHGTKLCMGLSNLPYFLRSGLIIGFISQQVARVSLRLFPRLQILRYAIMSTKWDSIKYIAIKYSDFPRYMLPGNWTNNLSRELPIFFFSSYYGSAIVGQFSFAAMIMLVPFALVTRSVGPVFLQKTNEMYIEDPVELRRFIKNLTKYITLLGTLPFALMAFYADLIFPYVFGHRWEVAGEIACYLSFFLVIRLLFTSIAPLFRVFNKEKYTLYLGLLLLISRGSAILLGIYFFDVMIAVKLFCLTSLIGYLIASIWAMRLVGLAKWVVVLIFVVTIPAFFVSYLSRYGLNMLLL